MGHIMKTGLLIIVLAGVGAGGWAITPSDDGRVVYTTSVGELQPVHLPPRVTVRSRLDVPVIVQCRSESGETRVLGTVPGRATRTFSLGETGDGIRLEAAAADVLTYRYETPPLAVGDKTVVDMLLGAVIAESRTTTRELDVVTVRP